MINSNPPYDDLIDAYFDNTMSAEQRNDFLLELENNAELKKEFSIQLEMQKAISDAEYDQVSAVINDVLNSKNNEQHFKLNQNRAIPILKYAVVIALLLLAALLLFRYASSSPSSIELAQEYFEPYPAYNTFRGNADIEILLESAFTNYESHNYKKALESFTQLSNVEPENMAYVFYQANTLLAMGEFEKAIPLFTKIIESENVLFQDQSNWYLALNHLGAGNTSEANLLLKEIATSNTSTYSQKATSLLKSLPQS